MSEIGKEFGRLAQCVRRHPVVVSVLILIAGVLFVDEALEGRTLEMGVYLGLMVLSAVIVDVSVAFFGNAHVDFPVRAPRTEIMVAAVLYVLGAATLAYRFSSLYPPHRLSSKLIFAVALFLFSLNIMLALFLLLRGYSLRNLGVRLWGFVPVPAIMIFCMGLVALTTPLRSTWAEGYRSVGGSIWGWVESGLLMAALPEEFFRMVWQTRVGKLLDNAAAGWLIASLFWAGLHTFLYAQGRTHLQTFFWVLDIVPYGLFLGYLTHRTKSILPAILLHATKFVWLGGLG